VQGGGPQSNGAAESGGAPSVGAVSTNTGPAVTYEESILEEHRDDEYFQQHLAKGVDPVILSFLLNSKDRLFVLRVELELDQLCVDSR
jgi:hypothetical protein